MPIQSEVYNGVPIHVENMPNAETVQVNLRVGYGSAFETDEHAGIAHALEHVLLLGTDQFPSSVALRDSALRRGIDIGATTTRTQTVFSAIGPANELDQIISHLSEVAFRPTFPESATLNEFKVIEEEGRTYLDDIYDIHHTAVEFARFGVPYGRSVGGFTGRQNYTLDDLRSVYRRYYGIGNLTVVAAGAVTPIILGRSMDRHFGDHTVTPMTLPSPVVVKPDGEVTGLAREDAVNVRHTLQYDVPPDSNMARMYKELPTQYGAAVEFISGIISSVLRDQLGICYGASFFSGSSAPNIRSFETFVEVDGQNVQTVRDTFMELISGNPQNLTSDKIEVSIGSIRGRTLRAMDVPTTRMNYYMRDIDRGRLPQDMRLKAAQVNQLTVAGIRAALQDIFDFIQAAPLHEHLTGPSSQFGAVDRLIHLSQFA